MHLTHILVNQIFDSIAMTRNGVTSHDSLSNGTIYVRYDDFIGVFPEVDMSQTSSRALISCRHTELNLILSLMQIQLFLEKIEIESITSILEGQLSFCYERKQPECGKVPK